MVDIKQYDYGVLHELNGINGATYDAIEYAYTLNTIGKTKLIIHCGNMNTIPDKFIKEMIIDIIYKKYKVVDIQFEIETKRIINIDRNIYKSLLFVDADILKKLPFYKADKYVILADFYIPNLYIYKKICKLPNVYTFNEMPEFPAPVNYKFKFAFDIYKTFDKLEDNTLISTKGFNEIGYMHKMEFINNKTKQKIEFKEKPIQNFHSHFNRYEYNNINYFDPRPKIFHESFFYGIKIENMIRNIKEENYDGAYYRLLDLKENGLEGRYLDINDEAIQMMIN